MRCVEYLDTIRRRHHIKSDYALAHVLGVTKQSVTHYRNGRSQFNDDLCGRVAMLLRLDPLQVLADMHAERATSEQARALWRMIAARAATAAASALVGAVMVTAPAGEATAAQVLDPTAAFLSARNTYYTKSSRRKGRRCSFRRAGPLKIMRNRPILMSTLRHRSAIPHTR